MNLEFNWAEIGVATMVLFAVIDIIGSVPIIISVKQKVGDVSPLRATLVACGIMLAFLFLGESLLNLIGVDVKSFSVAGSFVLFFMALEMVLGVKIFKDESNSPKLASVVPIAFPLIAGAGSMTTILSLRAEYMSVSIVAAILINMVIVYIVLRLTNKIEALLGPGGIIIMKKFFGIILLAIAVKLFSSNAKELFN
ncbi:MAG: MarC family protein [Flavobacteriales bacterium]